MITTKISKNILFVIEFASCIFGGISTFIITILTIILAKKKQQNKLAKKIAYIPFVALVLSLTINQFIGKTKVEKIIVFYIVFTLATFCLIAIQNQLHNMQIDTDYTGKRKRYIFLPILIIVIIVLLLALLIGALLFYSNSKTIEDTNGINNYELQCLEDNVLVKAENSFVASNEEHGNYGERTFVSRNGIADYDKVVYRADDASGVKVLQATKSKTETLELNIKNYVFSGNCKIVIVIDEKIYQEVELNTETNITINDILNREVFVVVGCESASIDIEISR